MSVELDGVFEEWDVSSTFLGGLEKTETNWRGRDLAIKSSGRREDEIFKEKQTQIALVEKKLQEDGRTHRLCGCEIEYPLSYEQSLLDSARSELEVVRCGLKKFWKKHKKAIIITAVVVTVVVCITVAVILAPSAAPTVVGAGGGVVAGAASDRSSPGNSSSSAPTNPNPPPSPENSPASTPYTPPPSPTLTNSEPPKGPNNSPFTLPSTPSTDLHSMLPSSQSPGFQPLPISFPTVALAPKAPETSTPSFSSPSLPQNNQPNFQSSASDMTKFWEGNTPSFSEPQVTFPNYSASGFFSDALTSPPQNTFATNPFTSVSGWTCNPPANPFQEMQAIAAQNNFSFTPGLNNYPINLSYPEQSFDAFSYQMRGENAHSFGCYHQAISDFSKAIEMDPTNPDPYLQRSSSHFDMGQYDLFLQDYHQYEAQVEKSPEKIPFSTKEFTCGFVKGLPKGIYESGKGICQLIGDLATHPIRTASQMYDALSTLAALAKDNQWELIGETLSPELHELITQWDTLPSDKRGELAGYALGKHGGDILTPGALAKVTAKGATAARGLTTAIKNLQTAERTLVLETAAGIGSSTGITEMVTAGRTAEILTEEFGLTRFQVSNLRQAGRLEVTLQQELNHLSLSMQESYALYERAEAALEQFAKKPMLESQVRALIHETGIRTFARPQGIPENYRVMISDKGAGMLYVHPEHNQTSIRVMPGKPHSPWPNQQKPYIIQMINGKFFDISGNIVSKSAPEAHIPLEEFIFIGD